METHAVHVTSRQSRRKVAGRFRSSARRGDPASRPAYTAPRLKTHARPRLRSPLSPPLLARRPRLSRRRPPAQQVRVVGRVAAPGRARREPRRPGADPRHRDRQGRTALRLRRDDRDGRLGSTTDGERRRRRRRRRGRRQSRSSSCCRPAPIPTARENTDPDDSIFEAEAQAARALVKGLDPRRVRVGLDHLLGRGRSRDRPERRRLDSAGRVARGAAHERRRTQVLQAVDGVLARGPRGATNFAAGVRLGVRELAGLSGARARAARRTRRR